MIKRLMAGAGKAQIGFILLALLLPVGCTSKAVPVEIPKDHPAHPKAAEATYTPPPNPFMSDIFRLNTDPPEPAYGRRGSEVNKGQDSGHGMPHKMMNEPSSQSQGHPHDSPHEHQHKEHKRWDFLF
jgi:hypothetical protein